ncbi:amino acid adenylation domain-containing protein [Ancylobacter sonchi]|uniref:amino acid adenylation domain-containing protein n=1 Tax=Ancylobacter sonchi TaxID=1937790 RepID=UPI001BD2E7A9|nr:non-ribosomal peptide synthetase [Ancylobacter sonchi]MBS7532381.1 amino acid adenylation domain-containing protein [Ancylobacter sonchi]
MRILPLVSTQLGIWLADQIAERGNAYLIAHAVELAGPVDPELLAASITEGLGEADTVSARFFADEAGAWQVLREAGDESRLPPIERLDFNDHADPQAAARAFMQADMATELPAAGEHPLSRQVLMNLTGSDGAPRWFWYQRYHHLMLDGFSFAALTRRIAEIYTARLAGHTPSPSPFTDAASVVEEHDAYVASPAFARDREFWRGYCRNLPPPCDLSLRDVHVDTPSGTAAAGGEPASLVTHTHALPPRLLVALEETAREHRLAVFDLIMAAVATYLYRVSATPSQVLGVPFMRRMGSAAASTVVPAVNVLPVRIEVDPSAPLAALGEQVKQALRDARRHQRYDAERIQRDLGVVGSGRALYGPVINYRIFDYDLAFGAVAGLTHHLAVGPVDDIDFGVLIADGRIKLELRGEPRRYSRDDLARHARRLECLIDGFSRDAATPAGRLPVTEGHEGRLLAAAASGRTVAPLDGARTVLDLFAAQVARTPEATALVGGATRLSFAEVAGRARALARHLSAEGIGPGDIVALAAPRAAETVTSLLGILESGATFLPLDLDHPPERLAAMCEDARPRLVLTTRGARWQLPAGLPVLCLDEAEIASRLDALSGAWLGEDATSVQPTAQHVAAQGVAAHDIAAIVFTSGSTGRPKGVMHTHGALINLISSHWDDIYAPGIAAARHAHPGRSLRAAHTHSFSFDSSWLQLFWLLLGQELHVIDEEMRRDAHGLVAHLRTAGLDAMDLPPSFCAQLMSAGLMEGAHRPTVLLIGGEAASPALWRALRAHPELQAHNLYGPTEYTVDTLRAPVHETAQPVVGRPIGNTRAHVLDSHLQPVPVGVVGELYIAGEGLARGYLGQAARTAERFVANPFEAGQRMYRTGDLVRWTADGRVEFIGRADHQVKVRGYRVETAEIEAALAARPDVETAFVVAEAVNDSHRLIAYCTLRRGDPRQRDQQAQELRNSLRQRLPDYMVPAAVMILDAFPLSVNGKVDRARLPAPTARVETLPSTPEEMRVARSMARALKLSAVGAESDFFALGGDSISAIVLCNALRAEGYLLRPRDVFLARDPRRMARALTPLAAEAADAPGTAEAASPVEVMALRARYGAIAAVLPALSTQKGMLFHAATGGQAENYNAFTRLELDGRLDAARLHRAFDAVLRRHPQLAGVFDTAGEEPLLAVPPLPEEGPLWPMAEHDLSTLEGGELESALAKLEAATIERALVAPAFCRLIHAELIRLSSERHVLLILVHHLMIDGWSTPLLLRDLTEAYRGDAPLPPLAIGYDRVVRQLAARDRSASRAVWAEALSGVRPCTLFDHLSPTATVEEHEVALSAEHSALLLAEARRRGLTLNMVMQAVWGAVLGAMAGRDEVVFGTPVSGRSAEIPGIGEQVGLFLNTVPIRVRLEPHAALWDEMEALKAQHAQLMEHDGLSLGEIQEIAGSGALFDTLLVVENYPDSDYIGHDLGGVAVRDIRNRGYSHYPLALLVLPGRRLTLLVENRGAVADGAALARRIAGVLEALVTRPTTTVAGLPLTTAEDEARIAAINATVRPLPALTLRDLLVAQAARTPEAAALVDAENSLSYRQVRHQTLALAGRLRASGVRPGDVVAVALPRSARLSLALLGVVEAGAAFLPLDLSYPPQRLAFMLEDAGPRLIIADASSLGLLPEGTPVLRFDALAKEDGEAGELPADDGLRPAHPCYVLYTSGTTGRPKGVVISHAAIVNRILWMQHEYPLGADDVVLQKTPCGFDVSVWEFFWSYMVGARLVMAPPGAHREPEELAGLIARHGVTTLHFVPSMLAIFLGLIADEAGHREGCAALRTVFASGEALERSLARQFATLLPQARLHNLYGPTEAAVDVTYAPAAGAHIEGRGGVPIGRPVWNTQLRILDHLLRPVPEGMAGELYLCGVQLADGYLGRPDLTAQRFVADPFATGARMYRTGDLARWLPDGSVEYLGRTDHQVKIRGQRVELGEIEAQMLHLPGVARAVAHAARLGDAMHGADARQIVGYVVPQPGAMPEPEAMREALKATLPGHMLPVAILVLEDLPLSANGKLDRSALPLPDRAAAGIGGRAPAEGLETRLAAIFADVLGREAVGAEEDFFAIGGHSLLAMRLAARIRRDLKRQVSVGQIVVMPTVARLAEHLIAGELVGDMAKSGFDLVVRLRDGHGAPLICVYPASGVSWQYSVLSRYLRADMPIIGLQSPRPHGPIAMGADMDDACERQLAILREVQPHGPYYLLGYSLGGTVAYGMAVRLRRMGEEVRFLGLLDTYPAEAHDWSDPQGAEANLGAEREQERFINDAMADVMDDEFRREKEEMFAHIFENYRDAVTLLSQATTEDYDGEITLFVAGKSMLPGIDPEGVWRHRVGRLAIHKLAHCSHEDIVSPASLKILGPLLDNLIVEADAAGMRHRLPRHLAG